MDEGGTCPSNDIASETGSTSEHTYSNGEHTCSNGEHTCSNGERLHTDSEATNVKETEKEQNDLERDNLIGMDADSISISSQAVTSTPVRGELVKGNVRFEADSMSVSDTISRDSLSSRDSLNPEQIRVPIQGFEIMEERAKFTVFKIKVEKSERDSWFVFRRYTDFVQLNEKLKRKFPNVRLSLPPKRWFKDNFDKNFIEDRLLGLQVFVDNCTIHKDICNSRPVREFFCFDDPPGPHDSLEESRALCESLEESVYRLRKELSEKDAEVVLLHEELDLYKRQVEMLSQALREKNAGGRSLESPASAGGTSLTSEFDLSTCPEADQSCLQVDNESEISSIVKEQDVKENQASQENIKEDKSKKKTSTSQASKKKFSMFKSKSSKAASTSVES